MKSDSKTEEEKKVVHVDRLAEYKGIPNLVGATSALEGDSVTDIRDDLPAPIGEFMN